MVKPWTISFRRGKKPINPCSVVNHCRWMISWSCNWRYILSHLLNELSTWVFEVIYVRNKSPLNGRYIYKLFHTTSPLWWWKNSNTKTKTSQGEAEKNLPRLQDEEMFILCPLGWCFVQNDYVFVNLSTKRCTVYCRTECDTNNTWVSHIKPTSLKRHDVKVSKKGLNKNLTLNSSCWTNIISRNWSSSSYFVHLHSTNHTRFPTWL